MATRKQLRKLIDKAKEETAKYFVYKVIGITVDATVVYGAECYMYQLQQKRLLCIVKGNWRFERRQRSTEWVKGRTTVEYYQEMPKK
jgi:hypothetical protein